MKEFFKAVLRTSVAILCVGASILFFYESGYRDASAREDHYRIEELTRETSRIACLLYTSASPRD